MNDKDNIISSAINTIGKFIPNSVNSYFSSIEHVQLISKIKALLPNSQGILIQYIDLANLYNIEHSLGSVTFNKSVSIIRNFLKGQTQNLPSVLSFIDIKQLPDEDFILIYLLKEQVSSKKLYEYDTDIRLKINSKLEQSLPNVEQYNFKICTGHYVIQPNSTINTTQTFLTALKQSLKNAKIQEKSLSPTIFAQFEKIMVEEKLTSVYQPILSLKNGQVLGWEALTRGPEHTYFHSPLVLFPYAQETGLLLNLEALTQKKAITLAEEILPHQKLFININSLSLGSIEANLSRFIKLLEKTHLNPKNIVFELTERTSIIDLQKFKKTMQSLKNKGFTLAVDDAGAGYSSLQVIAELQPDYIKLDMDIIKNINNDPVKEALVDTFVTFARKINAYLIAEGIESKEELFTLIKLGVHYGQGYLLGKPHYPKQEIDSDIAHIIKRVNKKQLNSIPNNSIPIGSIVQSCPLVTPTTTVETVMKCFHKDPFLEGVVVAKGMAPIGLVMRNSLLNALSSRYGVALYYKKPISMIMDANPLIVDEITTLEKSSQLATARSNGKLYDHVLVTHNGLFTGVVSIRKLLEVITQTKIRMAQYANPLTGLPGNIRIQEEITKIIENHHNVLVTYADIDKFKKFNDTYGFERGDQILLTFAKILKHTVKKYGNNESFLGHIGGDDFIIISSSAQTDKINTIIIKLFQRKFKSSPSVSLATFQVSPNRFINHLELAEFAAKAKGLAKKIHGNSYVKETENGQFIVCHEFL